jgi:hypothetical protein
MGKAGSVSNSLESHLGTREFVGSRGEGGG